MKIIDNLISNNNKVRKELFNNKAQALEIKIKRE